MGEGVVDTGVGGLGVDLLSSEEDAWCTSEADRWPGAAVVDGKAAEDGLPAGCADRPFGCGSTDEDAEAEAEAER